MATEYSPFTPYPPDLPHWIGTKTKTPVLRFETDDSDCMVDAGAVHRDLVERVGRYLGRRQDIEKLFQVPCRRNWFLDTYGPYETHNQLATDRNTRLIVSNFKITEPADTNPTPEWHLPHLALHTCITRLPADPDTLSFRCRGQSFLVRSGVRVPLGIAADLGVGFGNTLAIDPAAFYFIFDGISALSHGKEAITIGPFTTPILPRHEIFLPSDLYPVLLWLPFVVAEHLLAGDPTAWAELPDRPEVARSSFGVRAAVESATQLIIRRLADRTAANL